MAMGRSAELQIQKFHQVLADAWGPQHWWPAHSRFEVIAGAYLTQNAAWTNVERALANLRRAGALSPQGIRRLSLAELERLIRPAGYFRQKAQRLKLFLTYLDTRYGGSLRRMFAQPTAQLRQELLALNGIGPETADSILLYAGNHPVFVVDAYTRRMLDRHGILPLRAHYEEARSLLERALNPQRIKETKAAVPRPLAYRGPAHPPSRMSRARRSPTAQLYNEMHALVVGVGKNYCHRKSPDCESCPLGRFLRLPKRNADPSQTKVRSE